MKEMFCVSINISLKFVPMGVINNKAELVQVMAWCLTGAKGSIVRFWSQSHKPFEKSFPGNTMDKVNRDIFLIS